tara:strand:+ start:2561 stop:2824 length:264 start_codon:yes stop_codon:yes gene_type:complete
LSGRYYYPRAREEDEETSGIVIFDDLDTFLDMSEATVIIFDESEESEESLETLKSNRDVQVAFDAALKGHAEEISVKRLVRFYLNNS